MTRNIVLLGFGSPRQRAPVISPLVSLAAFPDRRRAGGEWLPDPARTASLALDTDRDRPRGPRRTGRPVRRDHPNPLSGDLVSPARLRVGFATDGAPTQIATDTTVLTMTLTGLRPTLATREKRGQRPPHRCRDRDADRAILERSCEGDLSLVLTRQSYSRVLTWVFFIPAQSHRASK